MDKTIFIFGYGYTARVLGAKLKRDGWTVVGTSRDVGADALLWPGSDISADLLRATHLLFSIAPNENGDPVLRHERDLIAKAAPNVQWAGYLSTTGVYGDHGGGWVSEETPLTPATTRGQWRVDAESAWSAFADQTGLPLHIFRLAGIYGPGRGPFAKVRNKTARRIIKTGQVFSRIHVEDIAQVLAASIDNPRAGAVYNVCDNDPVPPQYVLGYAAELLGMPLPPEEDFDTAKMTPMARSFYAESKRVDNRLIQEELGVILKYPNYRVGLEALLAAETND